MSGGFKVGLDELGAHEEEVRQIAQEVQTAVDASGEAQAAFDLNAFGLVGQVFALPIQAWISSAGDFLNAAAEAGHEVADRVQTAHTMYTEHETKTATLIEGIGKGLAS
jgi:hypothetical protein